MPGRILVVDDEVGLALVLTDLFEMEGYEVTAVHDVASAERELETNRFDLAMVDVFISNAPVGIGLAKKILTEHKDTGVVIMTGFAHRADIEAACLSGAYTCIDKPFNLDDVLRVAEMILDSRGEPPPT